MQRGAEAVTIYEYDREYDTRTNSRYGDLLIGLVAGLLFILLGLASIILTIYDLDRGIYNDNRQAAVADTLTLTENPFWPTYGKGFWVGLLMIATGIFGIMSQAEETWTSVI
jgi:hypothetical protein